MPYNLRTKSPESGPMTMFIFITPYDLLVDRQGTPRPCVLVVSLLVAR